MTNNLGPQKDPNVRRNFAASFEWGVSPPVSGGYEPMRPEEWHTVAPPKKEPVVKRTGPRTKPARKTKGMVVTAEDIRNHRGVV